MSRHFFKGDKINILKSGFFLLLKIENHAILIFATFWGLTSNPPFLGQIF